jgi:hypothetical protein
MPKHWQPTEEKRDTVADILDWVRRWSDKDVEELDSLHRATSRDLVILRLAMADVERKIQIAAVS